MTKAKLLYGTQKQQLKHLSANEYKALKELCFVSKNMYNVTLYSIRQHFFENNEYLSYESNYHLCKENENYQTLNSNSAQQIMKTVHDNFKSFFALLNKLQNGTYGNKVRIPNYLKKDGCFNLLFSEFNVKNNLFQVPMSNAFKKEFGKVLIKVPKNLKDKTIKEVRIIPKNNARFFEVQWIYEIPVQEENLNPNNVLAIDLGIDNLCTCATNHGDAFIVDGKKLKSFNQWANKKNAYLQSIKDKQKIVKTTKKQQKLWCKRNNQINDYINKSVRHIIDYCLNNDIGTIVIGCNKDIQKNSNLGKANNQNFVNIPIGDLRKKLAFQCQRYTITFIEQEESYTSKADFLASDDLPVYRLNNQVKYNFSGKRITRGQYLSKTGVVLNADINGALNILKKSKVSQINLIQKEYLHPQRINLFSNKKENKKIQMNNTCKLVA